MPSLLPTRIILWMLVMLAVLWVELVPSIAAAQDPPVSIDEIRQMRREGQSHSDIIKVLKQRGCGFKTTHANLRTLSSLGFTRSALNEIKTLVAAQRRRGSAPPRRASAAATAKLMEKSVRSSELEIQHESSTYLNVYVNLQDSTGALRWLAEVESQLDRHLPGLLAKLDRRRMNMVLLNDRDSYKRFLKAYFDNQTKSDELQKLHEFALQVSFFLTNGVCICNMSELSQDRLAFCLGCLVMEEATHGRGPRSMVRGFGNLSESISIGLPQTAIIYLDQGRRDVDGSRWQDLVIEAFHQETIRSVESVLDREGAKLTELDYATSWSLIVFLSQSKDRFARWVASVAGGSPAWPALKKSYAASDEQLLKQWRSFVLDSEPDKRQ